MKTPKEYTENLKKGIITERMLEDALFSVNKRAKNCRDKEREYRENIYMFKYSKYDYVNQYYEKKQEYYEMKDLLLELLNPTAVHIEKSTGNHVEKIYDYELGYEQCTDYDAISCYYGYDPAANDFREIFFKKKYVPNDVRYYLFYELGDHSFHTPVSETVATNYIESGTPIKKLDQLITKGHAINDLISIQFVKKIISVVKSGDYTLVFEG